MPQHRQSTAFQSFRDSLRQKSIAEAAARQHHPVAGMGPRRLDGGIGQRAGQFLVEPPAEAADIRPALVAIDQFANERREIDLGSGFRSEI